MYPRRRVPRDQFYPDMINHPYNKLIILLQTIDGKVLTSYIGCETIERVPGCSRIEFAHDINAFSRNDVDRCDEIELYGSLKADIS